MFSVLQLYDGLLDSAAPAPAASVESKSDEKDAVVAADKPLTMDAVIETIRPYLDVPQEDGQLTVLDFVVDCCSLLILNPQRKTGFVVAQLPCYLFCVLRPMQSRMSCWRCARSWSKDWRSC